MKILITGGSGLLGKKFINFPNTHDLFFTYLSSELEITNAFKLDIKNKKETQKLIAKLNPDIIFHTAAITNVDYCEKNKKEAYGVNFQGTKNLAESAEKINSKFVYVSTDYVFNGSEGHYSEEDKCDPINYYGQTKLLGEQIVKSTCSNYIIARTSVLYGAEKENFITWVQSNLEKNNSINIVIDQFISPTYNLDLVEQLFALVENDKVGVFHTAGGERISRYDFSIKIAEAFDLDKDLIKPIKMKDMKWIAKRPVDSSLNVSKISKYKKPYKILDALTLLEGEMIRKD